MEKPTSPLTFVLLCADGAVLLASVRRLYFRVDLRTSLDNVVCTASFIIGTMSLIAGSCLHAAADAQAHVVVACCLWARVDHCFAVTPRAN